MTRIAIDCYPGQIALSPYSMECWVQTAMEQRLTLTISISEVFVSWIRRGLLRSVGKGVFLLRKMMNISRLPPCISFHVAMTKQLRIE